MTKGCSLSDRVRHLSENSTQPVTHVPKLSFGCGVLCCPRYSRDLSGYRCLVCDVSSHCSHFEDIRRGAHYAGVRDDLAIGALEDEVKEAKAKACSRVQEDISKITTPEGQWQPRGHSTESFQTYSASQKDIIGDRLGWLTARGADKLSSDVGPQGTVPGLADGSTMGEFTHTIRTCAWVCDHRTMHQESLARCHAVQVCAVDTK